MTQPTAYNPTADFSTDAANATSGRTTINPTSLDAELTNVETTLDGLCASIALIQRDDGKIRDSQVELHTLSTQVRALFATAGATIRGGWLTATAYALKDVVVETGATYICATAHTSNVFATDLAASRWVMLMFAPSALAASGVSNTPSGTISGVTVQAAINEVSGDVTALTATVDALNAVPRSGATMTGLLVLSADPVNVLGAATRQYADDVIDGIHGNAGYFEFVSTTQLRFARRNGKRIFIEGAWYDIPSAGALLSNSGLSANTTYRVYAFVSGGVVTLEASVDARATDTTWGHQIRTGMPSRTLVGMCRANGSTQFYDVVAGTPQGQSIGVLSWFNRRRKVARSVSASGYSTAAAPWVEVNSGLQLLFLTWSDSTIRMSADGTAVQSAASLQLCYLGLGYDSVVSPAAQSYCMASNAHAGVAHAENAFTGSEGHHYLTPLHGVGGNTVTWTAGYVATLVEVDG